MSSGEVSWLTAETVARWNERALAREGATPGTFVDAEVRLGMQLPDELAELLLLADGMIEGETDDLLIRFWSANELKTFEGHILFADFSFCAHGYALDLRTGAVVIVGGPQPMVEVAVSLTHFLKSYLTNPARLFPDLRDDDQSERTVA